MEQNDNIEKMIEAQNLTLQLPEQEPQREYYFIKKAREIVNKKSEELGHPLLCCIQTFGCQMNFVPVI